MAYSPGTGRTKATEPLSPLSPFKSGHTHNTLHSAGPPTGPPNVDAGSHNPISDKKEAGNEMVVVQSDDIIIKHNSTEHLTTGVH